MNKLSLAVVLPFLLLMASCQKEGVPIPNTFENAKGGNGVPPTFTLGQFYGGGYIFYIDGSGQHGLIASDIDYGEAAWTPPNKASVSFIANSQDGMVNTKKIVQVYGNVRKTDPEYAALKCRNYRGAGFTDWYLGSEFEMRLLSQNQSFVPNLTLVEGLPYGYPIYWTSTGAAPSNIAFMYMSTGFVIGSDGSGYNIIRPIRKF